VDDLFHYKVMTELVRKFQYPEMLGHELAPEDPVESNVFLWDEIHQSRDLAGFTHPDSEANIQDEMVRKQRTAQTAPIKEKKVLSQSTLTWSRRPGQDARETAQQKLRDEMEDLDGKVERLGEWMIWEALQGELVVDQNDVQFAIDYGIPTTHQQTPVDLGDAWWDDEGNARVISNLLKMARIVEEDSGHVVTDVYMPSEVMDAIIEAESVKHEIGEAQLKEERAQEGRLTRLAGLNLETYDAAYVDQTGTKRKFIGDDRILMLANGPEVEGDVIKRKTAPATDPRAEGNPGKFSKTWFEEDPSPRQALIEYHVLPVIKRPENIYTAKVLE